MLFLSNFGVPASFAIKAWKKLGMDAQEIVSKNPYVLCNDCLLYTSCDFRACCCEIHPWTQKNGVTIAVTPFSAPRKAK